MVGFCVPNVTAASSTERPVASASGFPMCQIRLNKLTT